MKKYLTLLVLGLVVAHAACKKDEPVYDTSPKAKKTPVVTTVAGEGSPSFVNGPALSATFHFPEDVAIAPDGAIYVTDVLNFCIRKIAAGQVSTFAGGTGFDITDGSGEAAKFKNPYSITMDAAGNLYTTDENDARIRKITPRAEVSTFAGTAIPGFADGSANAAQFRPGNSLAADPQGNVYVADAGNNRIRKITALGQVTTIAGTGVGGFRDGSGSTAQFGFPGGIAIDKQGHLYVVDRGNFRIRKITPSGNVSTIAGSGMQGFKDGNAEEAQFGQDLHDIVVDRQGNVFVQDENRIRKITPKGIVSTIAGSTAGYADGDGPSARFNFLAGMGIDTKGDLYVADLVNNRIRKVSF